MVGNYDRTPIWSAVLCNSCALILLLFAAASPWWSWGVAYGPVFYPPEGYVSTSTGPWTAGRLYNTVPYTYCYNGCFAVTIGHGNVQWNEMSAIQACPNVNDTTSNILVWSGAGGLNLCTGSGSTRQFHTPAKLKGVQATVVVSLLLLFGSVLLGCVDGCSDATNRMTRWNAPLVMVLSWIAATLTLTAFSLWASWDFVQRISYSNVGFYIPAWSSNGLIAVASQMSWGPGFATAIAAFILQFFASVIHTLWLCWPGRYRGEEEQTGYHRSSPQQSRTTTNPPSSYQPQDTVAGVSQPQSSVPVAGEVPKAQGSAYPQQQTNVDRNLV